MLQPSEVALEELLKSLAKGNNLHSGKWHMLLSTFLLCALQNSDPENGTDVASKLHILLAKM